MRTRYLAFGAAIAVLVAALISAGVVAFAGPGGLTVTVGTPAISPEPVVRPDPGSVNVSATVTVSGDTGSTSSSTGNCATDRSGPTITGYHRTDTTTVIAFSNRADSGTATDNQGHSASGNPSSIDLTGGAEGKTIVTVSVTVTEDKTTTTTSTLKTWPASAGGCIGTPATSTDTVTASSVQVSGSGSNSNSYRTDLVGPVFGQLLLTPHTIEQGQNANVHARLDEGSSGKPFTVTSWGEVPGLSDPHVPESAVLGPSEHEGVFDSPTPSLQTGIAPRQTIELTGVATTCDTPVGAYDVYASLETDDLADSPFDTLTQFVGQVLVTPGLNLSNQTVILSDLPDPNGGPAVYGAAQCVTKGKSGNSTPGAFHLASVVTTAGACQAFGTFGSGTKLMFTIPPGFTWAVSGKSPDVHVFVGPNAITDYHYPPGNPEVTLKKSWVGKPDATTITVDLSQLDIGLGLGAGVIPASYSVYGRAKFLYSGPAPSVDATYSGFETTASTDTLGSNPQDGSLESFADPLKCDRGIIVIVGP